MMRIPEQHANRSTTYRAFMSRIRAQITGWLRNAKPDDSLLACCQTGFEVQSLVRRRLPFQRFQILPGNRLLRINLQSPL